MSGPEAWQESWDRQQEAFLPDREERFAAMFNVVEAIAETDEPAILDLAGGTGSISLRALRRFPRARTTLLDVDPVLLAIARASLDARTTIVTADLREPGWAAALPGRDHDAVLTATALHWIKPERLTHLYAEIRDVLRPGGILVNADYMPDDGLPTVTERLGRREVERRDERYAAGAVLTWEAWWDRVAADDILSPLLAQRRAVWSGDHRPGAKPTLAWHLDALRSAGFREVGLVWRGGRDAAVAALR